MTTRWGQVAASVFALAATACGDGKQDGSGNGDTGVVILNATAFNGGTAAQPRLVRGNPNVPLAPVATHTIDPASYRVNGFISGPATEAKITIKRIIAEGENMPGALLFGTLDGSGPGVEITLTNGTVDLSAIQLNPIPVGHYNRINIWPSRAVKLKGCVSGTFDAQAAMPGMYNGTSYTTDAITAGTHTFCTIASKGLLNFQNGTAIPSTPVGTDAEYEAQTTAEEIEIDMGAGFPVGMSGTYPTSAADVRGAVGNIDVRTEFDVDDANPVQLTLVVDLNRMLKFWPNTLMLAGMPVFQPPQPQGYPPGTSYFYSDNFNQTHAVFVGDPGSIEGYQFFSEICQDLTCMPGDPPDDLARGWITLLRDSSGAIVGGMVAPDDAPGAIMGDLVPTLTTAGTAPGTLRLSVGEYRLQAKEHGYIEGFAFKNVGDPEDSCNAYPIMGNGPVDGHGPFPLWFTRKL